MSGLYDQSRNNARRDNARRAFSLIELVSVLMIVGLLSSMAFLRFGESAFNSTSTEGFARTLMLDLRQARARTICTGDNHYILFSRDSGVVTSYTIYRDNGSGDLVVDRNVLVPSGALIGVSVDQWEFEFDGSLGDGTGMGSIVVAGDRYAWVIQVTRATGAITFLKTEV